MDFIQRGRGYLDTVIGITEVGLAVGEKDWAQLQILQKKKKKCEFTAKVQGGGQWMENY